MNDELMQRREDYLNTLSSQALKKASEKLTSNYQTHKTLVSSEELQAYVLVRMPATLAALKTVLGLLPEQGSILDLGAGPGTVWWAAKELWGEAIFVTSVEREPLFIEIGKKLGAKSDWIQGDISTLPFKNHDWVVLSYSLGEIAEEELSYLIKKAWSSAQKGVVIVEPGTPRGYHKILTARSLFLELGAHILAPCPHQQNCPLKTPDWCHFSVRLNRSSLHRFAKAATLPYEDEKFSYLIVTKEAQTLTGSRIIRPPMQRNGHVILPLCTDSGLENKVIPRSNKELYKKARKADWGDLF